MTEPMSPTAQKALERIRNLRKLTQQTGTRCSTSAARRSGASRARTSHQSRTLMNEQ
jgi:hypothetical protein